MPARKSTAPKPVKNKSLESWIWDAACSIRGAKDAPKYKDIIGKSYEYLIRKFAEGGGQSAGEWSGATWTAIGRPKGERGGAHQFYTPPEGGTIMSKVAPARVRYGDLPPRPAPGTARSDRMICIPEIKHLAARPGGFPQSAA